MNTRFVVVTTRRDHAVERACRIADHLKSHGLQEVRRSSRQIFLASPGASFEAFGPAITIFGTLYGRCTPPQGGPAGADGGTTERLARRLTNSSWGRYVAFFETDDDLGVMADPSGAGIGYEVADEEVSLLCDRVDPPLLRAAGFTGRVELNALHGCLIDPTTAIQAKFLRGVERLVPGRLYSLLGRHAPVAIWSPATVAERRDDPEDRLRANLDQTLSGLGCIRPLVQLSGGLDSSIVASSLAAIAPMTRAMTATSAAGDVEETPHARSAAAHAGVPLTEKRSDAFPNYRSFFDAPQIAHPYLHGLDDLFAHSVEDAGSDMGADAVVTGQGGDALFFHPPSPLVAVDRRRALGSWVAWRSLLDDARRSGSTIWHHLIPAELDRFRQTQIPSHTMVPPWVVRDRQSSTLNEPHPWTADAWSLPPGKRLHIMMLANAQIFHSERPTPSQMPLHHPLLSQPMMEAAMSIPVWMLASGSLNRGLARRAFASRIPVDVARRGSKGEATVLYGRAAVANLQFLRETLLGGVLASCGIVDEQRLEHLLTPDHLFYSLHNHSLILLASCEAWLRAWR
ncbi:asparagine synthase-related protein [Sphingomonas sp. PP-CE-1G-424]|uniref:asparagine synthase-related protein n=1 Tax=Sphingomonas sp. PP-CE-1G-424 TaxID=2135658 RepID=UPI0010E348CC|nr:asparagine synthase-related protein [Sphingomonas sp. PP-CE-1G-424]TCP66167.1 asparagine synthase (glutamine-hydrolysing) [Sphingomonas sp. PP-CE-1G-424]